jgi:hypothetical protein
LRILVRRYGTGSIALANTWFVEQRGPDAVLSRTDGSRLVDKGRRIEAANGNREEARAITKLALMKGWSAINFTVTDDFKQVAMAEALAAGIPVQARVLTRHPNSRRPRGTGAPAGRKPLPGERGTPRCWGPGICLAGAR